MERGGQFKLLRVYPAEGRSVATFRVTLADFGVVYLDVLAARFPGGRVGVEEIVRVNDGDRLTDMIRRAILPAAALRDPGLGARLHTESVARYRFPDGPAWREPAVVA